MKKKALLRNAPHAWVERCANPWNGRCEGIDVQLYIYYKGERLPIWDPAGPRSRTLK